MREGLLFGACLAFSTAAHTAVIAGAISGHGISNPPLVIQVSVHSSDQISLPGRLAAQPLGAAQAAAPLEHPNLSPIRKTAPKFKREPISPQPDAKLAPAAETGASSAGSLSSGSGSTGGVADGQVEVIFAPRPPYPWAARVAGFEGTLTLEILIGKDGFVKSAEVVESSGREDCDLSALSTIRDRWRFKPQLADGEPIECRERVVVRYALK